MDCWMPLSGVGALAWALWCGCAVCALGAVGGARADDASGYVWLENESLRVGIDPAIGAKIRSLVWKPGAHELADEFLSHGSVAGGLAEDRFAGEGYPGDAGTGVFEVVGVPDDDGRHARFVRISRDAKTGRVLRISKVFDLAREDARVTVAWHIENLGSDAVRLVPWVHNIVNKSLDKTVFPSQSGVTVVGPGADYFLKPWDGWISAWREGGLAVGFAFEFNAVMRQYYSYWNGLHSLEWAYFPVVLTPGERWTGKYHIVVAEGIETPPTELTPDGKFVSDAEALNRPRDPSVRPAGPFLPVAPRDVPAWRLVAEGTLTAWRTSPMERLLACDRVVNGDKDAADGEVVARGGLLVLHLALHDASGAPKRIRVGFDPATLAVREETLGIYRVGRIVTEVPSNFDARFPVGEYPDPLLPIGSEGFEHHGDGIQSVVIVVRVTTDCPVGGHAPVVTIEIEGGGRMTHPLSCCVMSVVIPDTPKLETALGCWAPKQALLDEVRYPGTAAAFQAASWNLFHLARFTPRESAIRWDAAADTLRSQLREWMRPPFNTLTVPGPVWRNAQRLRTAWKLLRDLGLDKRAFVYLIDEPVESLWPDMIARAAAVRATAPGLAILATVYHPQPAALCGSIDIWCRAVKSQPWMDARRVAGDRFWGVNLTPMEIEAPLFEVRKAFWRMAEQEFHGFLYWNVVGGYGTDNPWRDPFCAGINGNAHLLYPTAGGPVPTLRWLAMAQGCDDYDLLASLRSLAASGGDDKPTEMARALLQSLADRLDACHTGDQLERLRLDSLRVLSLAPVCASLPIASVDGL